MLGAPGDIEVIARESEPIAPHWGRALNSLASTSPELQGVAQGLVGQQVKLTRESVKLIQQHGLSNTGQGAFAGVVRHADGKIAGHLSFTQIGKAGAMAATLPALAAAVGLQLQQAELEKQLNEIKEDLDYLIGLQHDEKLASVAATLRILQDVYDQVQTVGELDDDHWQLVANELHAVRELHQLTWNRLEGLSKVLDDDSGNVAQRVKRLNTALRKDRTVFWLEAHIHAELALLRWQTLYLMRQADQHPDALSNLVVELNVERAQRARDLQDLANRIAVYLASDSHLNGLLDRLRVISRYRLDRLLVELDQLLRIYRRQSHWLSVGTPRALPPGQTTTGAFEPAEDSEGDRIWRELMGVMQGVPAKVPVVARSAATSVRNASGAVGQRIRRRSEGDE